MQNTSRMAVRLPLRLTPRCLVVADLSTCSRSRSVGAGSRSLQLRIPKGRSLQTSKFAYYGTTAATIDRNSSSGIGQCPSCSTPLPKGKVLALCPKCSVILPPPDPTHATTFFDLFDSPLKFDLDLKALKRKFLQLQQKVHPDLFSGQGEHEEWAKVWSSKVNDAFRILENDLTRGEYMLSLVGWRIEEHEEASDPELLEFIMEYRERLEDAETESQVEAIRNNIQTLKKEAIANLGRHLPPKNDEEAGDAKNTLIRLKYLDRIREACQEWSPGKRPEIMH